MFTPLMLSWSLLSEHRACSVEAAIGDGWLSIRRLLPSDRSFVIPISLPRHRIKHPPASLR
jgi:hypothetical protein